MIPKVQKSILIASVFHLLALTVWGQILHPAEWQHRFSKQQVAIGEEVDLIFEATIDPKWYLYSSDFDPDLGPKVTEFFFNEDPSYELVGTIRPINPSKGYDEIFEGDYTYFKGKGEFRQTIRILSDHPSISGSYDYQVCSDIDGKCIPFDEEFVFTGLTLISEESTSEDESFSPEPLTPDFEEIESSVDDSVQQMEESAPSIRESNIWSQKSTHSPYSLLTFILGAFFAGFLALLTPCVYPMIPMTVTFFTNDSGNRRRGIFNAIFYGLCIIVIFTLLGTLVSLIGGADFANWIATHWLPNTIFFIMFVFFALWFLGLFELNIPSNLLTKVDQKSDSGGLVGIFFMALTLVLVSFSCTGPFVGSILIASSSGHVLMPMLGMLGFSFAFALTFSAFAIFPEWLKSLPSSGSWLNTVKVVLGFLELALSLKFLSMVDQVYHWGILDRDVFIALWVAIMIALVAYLFGIVKLPSEAEKQSISIPRLLLGMGFLAFTVYLIPGMWGAPLKPLAGYLPPLTSQDYRTERYSVVESVSEDNLCEAPLYSDFLHLPHGLNGYFDLDQAINCAIEKDKPIFIDFTGHGCVNCREMEAVVWSDPQVLKLLSEDFMVVALYVDEKKELPQENWYTSEYDQKVKKTMGKQNADLQIRWYGNNAQPFYVLLDPKNPKQPLVAPVAYNKSVPDFIQFLEAGLKEYRSSTSTSIP